MRRFCLYVCCLTRQAPFHDEHVDAIIIMHDPIDWAPEIQVAVDVLIGGDPPGSGRPCGTQTPLFVSNDDFVFSGAYPFPRFAQGSDVHGHTKPTGMSPPRANAAVLVHQVPSRNASRFCTRNARGRSLKSRATANRTTSPTSTASPRATPCAEHETNSPRVLFRVQLR